MDFCEMDTHEAQGVGSRAPARPRGRDHALRGRPVQGELFSADIKAGNIVLDRSPLNVRFVDSSHTYCEHATTSGPASVYRMLASHTKDGVVVEAVVAAATLILLSANLSMDLYDNRRRHNLEREERVRLHVLRGPLA